jgi:preprotein translocase subunit SecF
VAFLMMIGYSVDTDILLTTRVLKKKHSINQEMYDAFKTGITMTLTSLVAVATALIVVYNFQSVLNQIFTILLIGLSFDIINTWTANASIIKWYAEKHK